MTDSLDPPSLNDDQEAAVTASLAPQMVVAGPGTGKTRALIYRCAYLIEKKGLSPSHLVVITFTRRAAAQLKNRLATIVGPDVQHVRAGTIHHFCYKTLRSYTEKADVPEDFVVVDDSVTDAFWQRWYRENAEWCERNYLKSYRQVKTRVSRIKLGIDPVSGRLTNGLRQYDEMLASRGALDFDDLLVKTRDLVRAQPDVRAELAEDTSAILVDEFQDTDPVQFDVIRRLGHEGISLFCVADDDQSVYRFRGARPQNVHRFIDEFDCRKGNDTLHILSTNYRSNRSIYAVAEAVLDSEERLKRRGDIRTLDDGMDPVYLVACEDAEDEQSFALNQLREWIDDGAARSDLAVLTRWNRRLAILEEELLRSGIACETSSAEDLLDTPVARKLYAVLRVIDARRRGRPIDGPMMELLEQMLPEEVAGRLQAFSRQNMPQESAWTVFQTVVSNQRALKSAGLDSYEDQLDRVYATIRNLLPAIRDDNRTIGAFLQEALRQLGGPLQLLSRYADSLTDPADVPTIRSAGKILARWQHAQGDPSPPRLLLHHRTSQIPRLWRQLVRRAFGLEAEPPAPLPEAQEALFARPDPDQEGVPPLVSDDVVVTTDLEAFLRWASRTGALPDPDAAPTILVLGPEGAISEDQQTLLGLSSDDVLVVDAETTFHSPSVRLFKALQAATGPDKAEPLFQEYVMVDLETTSLDPQHCRIAEIGTLKVRDGEIVDRFSSLVELPDDLTEDERTTLLDVCGLDPDTDFDDARPEEAVWSDFCAFVGTAPIVAHNGQRFDFRVLRRLNAEHEADAGWITTYDLLPAAHNLFPNLRRYSASALREQLLEDDAPTAHRALADCEDQQRILSRLQAERARQGRVLAHESLLPLLAAALTYESPMPDALSSDAEKLLQVGYVWALRDASPAGAELRSLLPRALTDRIRQHPLYAFIDEEAITLADSGIQPGLSRRLEALFEPFSDRLLLSDALEELLTHLALWGDDEPSGGEDVVTLSTYHSAKGLEFERVVCMDVHNSAFPPYFARDPEERRESRRLLYVGMTRAERHLVLTYPRREQGYDRRPSPFLDAAPDALLKKIDDRSEAISA